MLHVIRTENLLENARRTGEYLKRGLSALAVRCSGIAEVRGAGLFVGAELHANPVSGLAGSAETKRVVNGMCRRGVLIGSTGRHGNVLKIRSPLTFEYSPRIVTSGASSRQYGFGWVIVGRFEWPASAAWWATREQKCFMNAPRLWTESPPTIPSWLPGIAKNGAG